MTLEINQPWAKGHGWDSNARRAALFRSNFLRHWQAAKRADVARIVHGFDMLLVMSGSTASSELEHE